MQSRRSGLVHTWDNPKRCFQYSYIPRYNETLEITELPFGSLNPPGSGRRLTLKDVPPEVAAEINISLGSSGMYYYTRTWWERRVVDFSAWQHHAGTRLKIWRLKLRIGSNHVRLGLRWIRLQLLLIPLKLGLARNWCIQRWQSFKIRVIDALLGDDE